MSSETGDACVVICAYTEDRWDDLASAVTAVAAQRPGEIVVVIDHNDALLERARRELASATVVANTHHQGLSGARNTGIEAGSRPIVVFLDDDACPRPRWLSALIAPYDDPTVIGSGGRIEPLWATHRPRWWPPEFDWVVGCTYAGINTENGEIRNPIGASMSVRRQVFEAVGGFAEDLGRVGTIPLGCEETELAIRATSAIAGSRIRFAADAVVDHRVPSSRATSAYFHRRCFAEGISKASVAAMAGRQAGLSSERAHALRVLPKAVAREVATAWRQPIAVLRAAAIVSGLTATVAGMLYGRLVRSRPTSRPARAPGPIVLVNGWHDDNKGDAAIVTATLELVRRRWPGHPVRVHSMIGHDDPAAVRAHRHLLAADPEITVLPAPLPVLRQSGGPARPRELARWATATGDAYRRARWTRRGAARDAVAGAEAVVAIGGSNLFDRGNVPLAGSLRLASLLAPVVAAQRAGIDTFFVGHTLGPFTSPTSRRLARHALRGARGVVVRDGASHALALQLGVSPSKLRLAPDVAFLLSTDGTGHTERTGPADDRRAALVIRRTFDGDRAADRCLIDEMSELGCRLLKDDVVDRLVVVAHTLGPTDFEDDRAISRELHGELCRRLDDETTVELVEGDLSPGALTMLYGSCTVMIGVRLHAAILALAGGTPSLIVSYFGTKAAGVVDVFGESAALSNVTGFSAATEADTVARLASVPRHKTLAAADRARRVLQDIWDEL